jgi:hypothetical protein
VLGWTAFLRAREQRLAAEGVQAKYAEAASVGLEYLDPAAVAADGLPRLLEFVRAGSRDPDAFFACEQAPQFRREGAMLCFDSPSGGDGPNRVARARVYDCGSRERAVVLLPYWNAQREDCRPFGALLARCGITCLQLSLPYHDERQTAGVGFARELACENLGLTIRSNRQAILDARAGLTWLEQQGYRRIGIVGMSIGASLASIVAALDTRVRAAALILMADDFATAVWTGSATAHVRHSLEPSFGQADVRAAWSIISPASYAARLSARLERLLIVSGTLDTVFLPELTRQYVERLGRHGLDPTWVQYGCGHYTLALPIYAVRAFARTLSHLRACL